MRLANVVRTSAFRLTLLYTALFSASAMALLAFIYWSTVAVIERQTLDTIEAEIRGLAEQYRQQGLLRLTEVVRERSGPGSDSDSVYLLTDPRLRPLAGNLGVWPREARDEGEWIELSLNKREDGVYVPHRVRARTFVLAGGYRLLVGRDMHEKSRFRATVITALGWSLAATVGLGLVGGAFISRRMLARVDRVTQTASRIMNGDLGRRIERGGSGDEFDRLADSLNAMFERIERLMTGMRLATDSIAHDLRGPLTRLKGRIELALRRPPETNQDREALEDSLAQTDAALAVFDSLLKIAVAEAGVDAADLKPVDLAHLVGDAVDLYEPVAEEKGTAVDAQIEAGVVVRAQAELLAQAVANVLDNAVRHTPAGGRIAVGVRSEGDWAVLIVADTGPGIPEADRARALERFVRLDSSRSGPGAGLGLSLVAAVARLHGAELHLDDNQPGLRVRLSFPRLAGVGRDAPVSGALGAITADPR